MMFGKRLNKTTGFLFLFRNYRKTEVLNTKENIT